MGSFPTALRHARTGPQTLEFFLMSPVGRVSLKSAPTCPLLARWEAYDELLRLPEAFRSLAHGRARRRHDRNRQNGFRELQSFMRFWRVLRRTTVWEDNEATS